MNKVDQTHDRFLTWRKHKHYEHESSFPIIRLRNRYLAIKLQLFLICVSINILHEQFLSCSSWVWRSELLQFKTKRRKKKNCHLKWNKCYKLEWNNFQLVAKQTFLILISLTSSTKIILTKKVSRISHPSPTPLPFCYFSRETPVICMAQI